MALIRESEAYAAAQRAKARQPQLRTAERILKAQPDPQKRHYDIFLSHSIRDADLVLGAKTILEELGHSVYVDWIDDPQLDRGKVNRETAALLRARMTCCASLMYLHTRNSPSSKWMPWELGYFDGHNGNVAILPIIGNADSDTFQGQEYLGLYPYVDITGIRGATGQAAWVNKSVSQYIALRSWKTGDRDWRLAG